jgi:HEAT repeat protein
MSTFLNTYGRDGRFHRLSILKTTKDPKVIDKALDDEDWMVRAKAAEHPNATKEHLDKALGDEDPSVRAEAKKNLASRK